MLSEDVFDIQFRAKKNSPYLETDSRFVISGIGILALDGVYDPDQHWFEFMQGAVFKRVAVPESPGTRSKINTGQYAAVPDNCRRIFVHERDQFNLPFHEFRNISNREFDDIRIAGYTGWDRDDNGNLYSVAFSKPNLSAVSQWCAENCTGRYKTKTNAVFFQRKDDFLLASIIFGGTR